MIGPSLWLVLLLSIFSFTIDVIVVFRKDMLYGYFGHYLVQGAWTNYFMVLIWPWVGFPYGLPRHVNTVLLCIFLTI